MGWVGIADAATLYGSENNALDNESLDEDDPMAVAAAAAESTWCDVVVLNPQWLADALTTVLGKKVTGPSERAGWGKCASADPIGLCFAVLWVASVGPRRRFSGVYGSGAGEADLRYGGPL